ncbi:MAG: protein-L-isoaspartate O-methyltransferase [Patescibacteria group bacterium]
MNTKEQLIRHLEETKVLQTLGIKKTFEKIDRVDFVNTNYKNEAYEDYPLPIGFGQTISQPTTVAFMLELIDLKPDHKVLDIGSGSGYTTALIAHLVPNGEVLGLEIIPELARMGKNNLKKYGFPNAEIKCKDGRLFVGEKEKFDRILVNATAEEIPKNLVKILKPRGVMVIPIRQSVFRIHKKESDKVEFTEYPGFAFVKLK